MANEVEIVIKAVDEASDVLGGIAGGLSSIAGPVALAAGAALAVAGAGLTVIAKQGMEAQSAQALFNATIDRSPLVAYKDQLIALADAKVKTTKFSDDEIIAAETILARYGNLGDKIPQVAALTLDFATAMGTDASGAALQLGKAFEDIEGGSLSMIARSRLITAEQKKQAEEMAKAGDAAGAQAYIIDILQGKVGGLAETMGDTFEGKMTIFRNTLDNMAQTMGGPLLVAIQPLLDKLVVLAQDVAPKLAEVFTTTVVPAISRFIDWLTSPAVIDGFGGFISQIKSFAEEQGPKFAAFFQENGPTLMRIASGIASAIGAIVPVLLWLTEGFLGAMGVAISVFLAIESAILRFVGIWTGAWSGIFETVKRYAGLVGGVIDGIVRAISGIHLPSIGGGGGGLFGGQHAFPGPVYAGVSYTVGERGAETFTPMLPGMLVPNGGNKNVSIVINGSFRSTSDLDYLAQEIQRRINTA